MKPVMKGSVEELNRMAAQAVEINPNRAGAPGRGRVPMPMTSHVVIKAIPRGETAAGLKVAGDEDNYLDDKAYWYVAVAVAPKYFVNGVLLDTELKPGMQVLINSRADVQPYDMDLPRGHFVILQAHVTSYFPQPLHAVGAESKTVAEGEEEELEPPPGELPTAEEEAEANASAEQSRIDQAREDQAREAEATAG